MNGEHKKPVEALSEDPIPQTSPEDDATLAEWHQQRFLEANKPKRHNSEILRELMDDPNRESVIYREGSGRFGDSND